MTSQQHPITPPPELVREWAQINGEKDLERFWMRLATQAARWGADQELEACCEWVQGNGSNSIASKLRAARRPKPPSLKEQALAVIENSEICDHLSTEHAGILRRALEQLDD